MSIPARAGTSALRDQAAKSRRKRALGGGLSGTRPDSPHYSTPRRRRKRRGIQLTLSDKAMRVLILLARREKKSRSKIVEDLLLGLGPV
jgi:hypothetical protein